MLVIFKEMGESELVSRFLLILIVDRVGVRNSSASTSPFRGYLFGVPIADFHALIIKATAFGKSLDDEVGLSFNAFDCEVEPR